VSFPTQSEVRDPRKNGLFGITIYHTFPDIIATWSKQG